MKCYYLIFSFTLLCSCEQRGQVNEQSASNYDPDSDIVKEKVFISNFIKLHSNIQKNDAQKDFEAQSKLFLIKENYLSTIPLKIEGIFQSPNKDGKYVVHADYQPADEYEDDDVYKNMHLDIFDFTTKEIAQKLNQSDSVRYFFKAVKKAESLDFGDLREFTNSKVWAPEIKIYLAKPNTFLNDDFSFGCYKVSSDSIVLKK